MPASTSIPDSSPCSSRSPQHAPLLPHACSTNRRSAPHEWHACLPPRHLRVVLMRRTWRRPFHRTRSRCGFVSALPQPSTPEPPVSSPLLQQPLYENFFAKTPPFSLSLSPHYLNPNPETRNSKPRAQVILAHGGKIHRHVTAVPPQSRNP